ncbi:glycosyltransferase family 1 protein [Amphritea sp.]|uniref:glycosyltransferase family 1 protein n=1 Tax=Amphritea sp. TaxID=1872502 RepID=UPI003A8D8600
MKIAFVVEESVNPSSDFFVIPELKRQGYEVRRFGFGALPSPDQLTGKVIVFVRYVPKRWKQLIDRLGKKIEKLIYFMDDDLFSLSALSGLPLKYQLKLLRYAFLSQQWLKKHRALYWVSTPYLQLAYKSLKPVLILPTPMVQTTKPLTIFYHGSASHTPELKWLIPVIETVLDARENTIFEVIGNADVCKLMHGMSRINILQPMRWPSYQSLIARGGRDIGLAPLLDSPFNRARSHTKFFDITAAGGVGVYANQSVYNSVVEHQRNGLLASMEHAEWISMILNLIDEAEMRNSMLMVAQRDYERFSRK